MTGDIETGSSHVSEGSTPRLAGLDAARGVAVLAMTWMHLVPADGPGPGPLAARWLEGKAAALFFLLAGAGWWFEEIAYGDRPGFTGSRLRRAGVLAVLGAVLHATAWTTEVLLPMATLLIFATVLRRWPRAAALSAAVSLGVALVVPMVSGKWLAADWLDDGSHRMDSGSVGAWVRGLSVDGSYPWAPWWAVVWAGGWMARGLANRAAGGSVGRMAGWLPGGAALLAGIGLSALGERLGGAGFVVLSRAWEPTTTVPFVLVAGGSAWLVAVACAGWRRPFEGLVALGRWSLTVYVAHIVLLIGALRLVWPGDDWPAGVGMEAWFWWSTATVLGAWWWRARGGSRGPLEALCGWATGRRG
ncbi:MAG: hypothetical protein ACKO5K_02505 [Armatimonadota bacterium]